MPRRVPHQPRRWLRVRHIGFWKHYWRHGLRTVLFITGLMFLLEHQGCTSSWDCTRGPLRPIAIRADGILPRPTNVNVVTMPRRVPSVNILPRGR